MGRAKKSTARKPTRKTSHPKPSVTTTDNAATPQATAALADPTLPSLDTAPLFAVTHIPSRGLGLLATSPIPAGTRIISETPLIILPPKYTALRAAGTFKPVLKVLTEQYTSLDPPSREQILLLSNCLAAEIPHTLLGTFMSNARELDEVAGQGLCTMIARVNHSCVPNAVTHWNRETERLNLHAVRDIDVGEEITLGYIMLVKSGVERRRELKERWGFDCRCEACMLAPEAQAEAKAEAEEQEKKKAEEKDGEEEKTEEKDVEMDGADEKKKPKPALKKVKQEDFATEAERDKLITNLLQLRPHIQQTDTLPYKVSLRCREKAITLFRQLHIAGSEITTTLFGAAMKAAQANDNTRRNFFLQMVYENILTTEGLDSLETLLTAPSLPRFADVKELSEEIEKAIDSEKFEDWLWGDDRVEIDVDGVAIE